MKLRVDCSLQLKHTSLPCWKFYVWLGQVLLERISQYIQKSLSLWMHSKFTSDNLGLRTVQVLCSTYNHLEPFKSLYYGIFCPRFRANFCKTFFSHSFYLLVFIILVIYVNKKCFKIILCSVRKNCNVPCITSYWASRRGRESLGRR